MKSSPDEIERNLIEEKESFVFNTSAIFSN